MRIAIANPLEPSWSGFLRPNKRGSSARKLVAVAEDLDGFDVLPHLPKCKQGQLASECEKTPARRLEGRTPTVM
jgi:hypothetical protein